MVILVGDKDVVGVMIDFGEMFVGCVYCWGIDNWYYFFKVVVDQVIKQGFVGVLDVMQINMFVDFSFEFLILDSGVFCLFFDSFNYFWQQVEQVEIVVFFYIEGVFFVEQGEFKQNGICVGDVQGMVFFMGKLYCINFLIMIIVLVW